MEYDEHAVLKFEGRGSVISWVMPAFDVFEEKSSVIDVISVFGGNLDSLEARCLFDDGPVKNGVVEGGCM